MSHVDDGSASALYPRQIGDAVHRITETREQPETGRAAFRIGIVDHHALEKGVDRGAERSERGHGVGEALLGDRGGGGGFGGVRSAEHTSELQSLMRIPSSVFCLK